MTVSACRISESGGSFVILNDDGTLILDGNLIEDNDAGTSGDTFMASGPVASRGTLVITHSVFQRNAGARLLIAIVMNMTLTNNRFLNHPLRRTRNQNQIAFRLSKNVFHGTVAGDDPTYTKLYYKPEIVNRNNIVAENEPSSGGIYAGDPSVDYTDADGTRSDIRAFGGPGADGRSL